MTILGNTTIGEGSIIQKTGVVNDIPPLSYTESHPATVFLKKRDEARNYNKCKENGNIY